MDLVAALIIYTLIIGFAVHGVEKIDLTTNEWTGDDMEGLMFILAALVLLVIVLVQP